ncbi:MAG: DUF4906 domain-containing protein [Muribaculaceae bacterium]|nr:DUF4906 domain-containing protein [Muribaculaceae bacterium]
MKLSHILIVMAAALLCGCAEHGTVAPLPDPSSAIILKAEAVEMLPEVVSARSGEEPKTAAEKKINRLHLFFFDKDGEFLTPDPECEVDFRPYQIIDMTESGLDGVEVPKNAFMDQQTLEGVQIFAVANPICDDPSCSHTSCSFRVEELNPDGDICHGDADNPQAVKIINSLADLQSWYYRPAERTDITELPAGGMPMVALYSAAAGDCVLGHSGQIQIPLRALMARVDVKVKLEAKQTSKDRLLPTLKVTEYGVKNMPLCVPFTAGETTAVPQSDMRSEKTVKVSDRTLVDGQEAEVFTYYTYENIKQRTQDPMEIYPDEVKGAGEEVRQRWKPLVAPENASAIVMRGRYVDHQGMSYDAQFSVYLGSDVIDNFEVKRNHCYKNNIFISGLDYVRGDDNVFIFDARVNVSTFNAMYLSIINERHLDAHWCVLPMDVYFLDKSDASSQCTVTILGDATSWVHLEHVSSEGMSDADFKPGWGCRDYFTTDMLQNVVTETSAQVSRTRDRIYFYVDENSSTRSRTARVEVKYQSATESYTDTLELEQYGLLSFIYNGTTYYMEAVEEYAEHYDPLDPFGSTPWYQPEGIPWAAANSPQNGYAFSEGVYRLINHSWSPFNMIYAEDGLQICNYLLGLTTYSGYDISSRLSSISKIYADADPISAISVACSKNKKAREGETQTLKWFLPGISQLEVMLETKYNEFPTFQEYLYWSANPSRNPNLTMSGAVRYRENPYRARATKVNTSGKHVLSELDMSETSWSYPSSASQSTVTSDYRYSDNVDYEDGGGRTLRTQKLRVRAIRVADGVSQ